MKGDTDPWSRKISLASQSSQKYRHGHIIPGPRTHLDFDAKEARIIQLQWKGRMPKGMHLEIEDLGIPSRRIIVKVPGNWQSLVSFTEDIEFRIQVEKDAISDWTKVLHKAESNLLKMEKEEKESRRYIEHHKRRFIESKQAAESKFKELNLDGRNRVADKEKFRILEEETTQAEDELKQIQNRRTRFDMQHRSAKEQLALVAEIVNELLLSLAFYEEAYLILKMFKLEDYEIPDVDRDNPLHFLHTQLSHLGQSSTWGLEQETLEQYHVSPKYRKKTMFEAYMSELNRMKDSLEKQRETRFEVESPYRNTPLRKDVLSFGQKSTILTELYLGTFEALSDPSSDIDEGSFNENRYCLIIDEPEVGRSEYSLDHLIKRLIWSKGAHDAELKNSVVVLSHRNKLLKQVSGKYHLLQPVDIGYQTEEEEE